MPRLFYLALALAIIAVGTIVARPSHAQTLDGNFLYRQCQMETGLESAYITGVVDSLTVMGTNLFELPSNSIVKQNRDLVCNGLADDPEYRNAPASVLVHAYMAKAWPKGVK